ncbi:fatty-acyl-CoA synthase [Novosphingobium kunmingense]|uniref:Fatty-acyl-CoA synthase n=1 Tax=Novosphingobium kunmingense TaxID=1211806 RepID=A0A2N0H3C4_9SPHN|nr:long-chain-fatty-acid--CoA ligase [Novosphingobium kunmingense]PKB13428.1 fatty-acyl-CoA synthase [Novosphingobium kunmingense]
MLGLMQDWPLTVDKLIDHAARWHGDTEVVSRDFEGRTTRSTYAAVHADAKRVTNALRRMGVQPGDRVATMGWNGARHLAAWYGIQSMGAVCHTLNPRLFLEQIAYIANHAGDRMLIADPSVADLVDQLLPLAPSICDVIWFCAAEELPAGTAQGIAFDDWIAGEASEAAWGEFDENTACGLCYTSGTTGNPKGVLYSHRSNYLHALMTLQRDALALNARDSILLVVPMYHANAWGIVYSAPAVGAKLVLPGQKLDGPSLQEQIVAEGCTYSTAVPTIWQSLLTHLDETGLGLGQLERVVVGGSALPEAIVTAFRDRYGVDVIQGWGMTETSPLATVSIPNAAVAALDQQGQLAYKLKQGRLLSGLDLKIVDDEGARLPHDGRTPGRLMIKGPTICSAYFGNEAGSALDGEGFFDTGDIASLDQQGYMQITDRAKDVIKSGGEWISSIDVENIVAGHPKVALAAVIGVTHPKWDERPILLVQLRDGVSARPDEFREWLGDKIARWWMPDDVLIVPSIPLGPTGKIDKKEIRAGLTGYTLPFDVAGQPDKGDARNA